MAYRLLLVLLALSGCDSNGLVSSDAGGGTGADGGSSDDGATGCTLIENTSSSGTGLAACNVLTRDTSSCAASRMADGFDGYWLKFSCRVTLSHVTVSGHPYIRLTSDDRPDYESVYFPSADPCHEAATGSGIVNPNRIAAQAITLNVPSSQSTQLTNMAGINYVGMAVNGVVLFSNQAAPGDDIYQEAKTFDRCGAHPQMSGVYHYHSEPYSVSYDDSAFIGVMLDGYPIYGRRDADGTVPTDLDAAGAHMGTTVDSATPGYHYHVNLQTSTASGSAGQTEWFLTTGQFRGTPGTTTP